MVREKRYVAYDVVRNGPKDVVAVVGIQDCSETVLEVVSSAGLKLDSVNVEPRTPKGSSKEVNMAVCEATSVVAEANVHLRLDVEVDHTKDALGGQKGGQGVDDRVVVGLVLVSMARSSAGCVRTIMERLYDIVTRSAPPDSGRFCEK